jgi:uncharacterized protein DUF5681
MSMKVINGSGRFSKGVSGNPAGRPPGSRNRGTLFIESLLEAEAESLTRKVIELAKEGDRTALRLCMERLLPVRKDRSVAINVSPSETIQQILVSMGQVFAAIAEGVITPAEGESLTNVLVAQKDVLVKADLERRIEELERRNEKKAA